MTREIKFRAWDIKLKKMWEMEGLGYNMFDNIKNDELVSSQGVCKLMQYTGLKDKNGVEIYEGDVVLTFAHMDNTKENSRDVVSWNEKEAKWKGFYPSLIPWNSIEIIGNIWEDKHLLDNYEDKTTKEN